MFGDPRCGDQGQWWRRDDGLLLCLVDGLGHGPNAETAALAVLEYMGAHRDEDLHELFAGCDRAVRHTRGAAAGLAHIDERTGVLTFAGIGNIWGLIRDHREIRMISDYGIVGGGYRKLRPETYPLEPGNLVMLATDGIQARSADQGWPSVPFGELQAQADMILERWGRKTDDAAVMLYRYDKERP